MTHNRMCSALQQVCLVDNFLIQGPKVLVRAGLIVFNQFGKALQKQSMLFNEYHGIWNNNNNNNNKITWCFMACHFVANYLKGSLEDVVCVCVCVEGGERYTHLVYTYNVCLPPS